jgi:hypothetical protein
MSVWTTSGPLVGYEMDGIRDGDVEISYRFHCQCARAIQGMSSFNLMWALMWSIFHM